MKALKFSEAQIAFVLKQAEAGTAIGEVCRKAGISEATFYNWRKRYPGLMPLEVKRSRQLEEENAKLKRIVADLSLDRCAGAGAISRVRRSHQVGIVLVPISFCTIRRFRRPRSQHPFCNISAKPHCCLG